MVSLRFFSFIRPPRSLYSLLPTSARSSTDTTMTHASSSSSSQVDTGSAYPSGSTSPASEGSPRSLYYDDKPHPHSHSRAASHDVEALRTAEYPSLDAEEDEEAEGESHSLLPFGLSRKPRAAGGLYPPSAPPAWWGKRKCRITPYVIIGCAASSLLIGAVLLAVILSDEPVFSPDHWSAPNAAGSSGAGKGYYAGSNDTEGIARWKLDARVIPSDPTHILLPPHPAPSIPFLEPLHDRLPYPLLSHYFSTGLLPPSLTPTTAPPQHPLDLVYLFVNASSPYLLREMDDRAEEEGVRIGLGSGRGRHWRDNGELRAAVRSGVAGLGDEAGRIHVITADWGVRPDDSFDGAGVDSAEGGWRIGQVAEWLNWDSQVTQDRFKWHFHSDLFQLPKDGGKAYLGAGGEIEHVDWKSEEEWKAEAMPSFNSFGIESRMAWLDDLSENYISFNDDMFLLKTLSTSDFRHPLGGNLLRLDPGLTVPEFMTPKQLSDSGEWGALQHANQLLSARFSPLRRMYMHHLPKVQSRALLHEASVMWAGELSLAATRGFRESKKGAGDVEMAWLITHLRVERWREALLWSWVVAKVGGVDGVWAEEEKDALRKVLGLKDGEGEGMKRVQVERQVERSTLSDLGGLMDQAGWEGPKATHYEFSSLDGHLPPHPDTPPSPQCTFQLDLCLPPSFFSPSQTFSASDLFTRFAFEHPDCGTCLIDALVAASGKRGIEAFLPAPDAVFFPPGTEEGEEGMWRRSEPMLPLVGRWQDGDFGLGANVRRGQDVWEGAKEREDGGVELRRWVVKLLSRYNYIYGTTPSRFAQIHSTMQLIKELNSVDTTPELAMLCMNDDQADKSSALVRERFGGWMEGRWGGEMEGVDWEREGVEWVH
ncbi:hypothetical protein IAT38_005286 [Cryptococcus sp. DSM 104549]